MRIPKNFVGLHGHSGFSTYDGLGYPKEHMDFALENGMDAWALTDHGHMNSYAHAQFHQWDLSKKGKQFKYIPGVEFYLHPDLKQWQSDFATAQAKKTKLNSDDESEGVIVENESESKQTKWYDPVRRRHHLVVIPKSQKGLKNLFTLVSRSYSEGFYKYPRIDYRMLKEHGEDLIVSTACLAGPMSYEIMKHHQLVKWEDLRPGVDTKQSFEAIQKELKNIVDKIVDAVGMENFSLELQFNKLPAQHLVNQHLIRLSRDTGVKLIATADSHYPRPDMWKDRELYKKLGWMGSDKFEIGMLPQSTDELECELYPKNAQQMWDAYKDSVKHLAQLHPDISWKFYDDDTVCDAIERTYEIAHQQVGEVGPDTSMKLPSFVVEAGKSDFETLVDAVKQGMRHRCLDDKPEYIERMKEELDVIKKKGFSRYFLVMKAIMDAANENMLTGVGRGSGAGSLVNYVLGITGVDPIKYNLLFARFISMGREEFPDVDSDVASNDELKHILRKKFGDENVLPISNYNTLQLKSLIKDISKFYGIPFEDVNVVTKGLESEVMKATMKKGDDKNVFVLTYDAAYQHSPRFRDFIDRHPHVGEHIKVLFKQNKSIGRHAGGVIIAEDIQRQMPVIKVRGEAQTPWTEGLNYRHLGELGWIKFDLLGLKTLRIIDKTIRLILQRQWESEGGMFTLSLGDQTFEVSGNTSVILRDGTTKTVKEISKHDDIIQLSDLWKES